MSAELKLGQKGEKFWCYLKPNSIIGLRHSWIHPVIDRKLEQINSEHEVWLREFAEEWRFNFDDLIHAGTSNDEWRYATAHGRDLHRKEELNEGEYELFWYHLEKYTGLTFSPEHREGLGWSCTC